MFDPKTIVVVSAEARQLGVEPAAILAVADVESAGVTLWTFDGQSRPPIRFEGHHFYRRLTSSERSRAVASGLASPKAGAVKNPASYRARYQLLERAKQINPTAALESTSWGLGQVMGEHWKKLGYASVQQLVEQVSMSVGNQIDLMIRYIKAFGLVDELQSKGWKSFAVQYNGPAAAKNDYAGKIERAYRRYSAKNIAEVLPTKDSRIGDVQKQLQKLGFYKGAVDGIRGDKTISAIKRFQAEHGLVADGKAGPMTIDALDKEVAKAGVSRGNKFTGSGMSVTAVTAAGDAVNQNVWSLQSIGIDSQVVSIVVMVMVVAGIALSFYGLYLRMKHGEAAAQ